MSPPQLGIEIFEKKYEITLVKFKIAIEEKEEEFEEWDDYIEWKANVEGFNNLQTKITEIENAKDIEIV